MVAQGVCERQLRYGKYDLRIIQLGAGYPDEERFDIEIVGGRGHRDDYRGRRSRQAANKALAPMAGLIQPAAPWL